MRLFFRISGIVLVLIVTGILVFLWTLDLNRYKPALEETVSKHTGREFTIRGEIGIAPSLNPAITANGIRLANAPWALDEDMISAEHVEARVALLPLLTGVIHVKRFILHDTHISLERNTDGSGNWELEFQAETDRPPPSAERQAASLPPVTIEEIDIRNLAVSYRDRQTGTSTSFNLSELTTTAAALDAPMNISIIADYDDQPLHLGGTLGPLATLLADEHYSFDLSGGLGPLHLTASGSIARPMQLQGADVTFSGQLSSLADLQGLAGLTLPDMRPVNVGGQMKFDDMEKITIEDFGLQLGRSDLRGTIDIHTGAVPLLSARLQSDMLDLTPFADDGQEQDKAEFFFPRDTLPLAGLTAINTDLALAADLLRLPGMDLDHAQLALTLQDSDLQILAESGLATGRIEASLALHAGRDSPVLQVDIHGADILLEHLPHKQEKWFTGGPVAIQVNGRGRGGSVAELMGSFNGRLLVRVGEAIMPNTQIDLFGADILMSTFHHLNPLRDREDTSVLECLVINLDIRDGLIRIDRQIAMQTAKMSMVGSGEINLKDETLDLGLKPYAREGLGLNIGGISGVARIGGTLANPRPQIDAKGTLTAGISAGAAIATGGLSLLAQGLFNRARNDAAPCDTALGATGSVDTPVPSSAETDKMETGILNNVKGRLRGLFSN